MSKLRVETEWDKNINAMADSLFECKVTKTTGDCTESMCADCEKRIQQQNVWNNMADIDRLRVKTGVNQRFEYWLSQRKRYALYKKSCKRDAIGSVLYVVFLCLLLVIALMCCSASSMVTPRSVFENNIENCLRSVRKNERDINKDGIINCQDYTILFYEAWNNSNYPNKETIGIVRNYNEDTGMNHLFIAVRITMFDKWEYVEPQAWLSGDYTAQYYMADFWGSKYNPLYNRIDTAYLYKIYYADKLRRN